MAEPDTGPARPTGANVPEFSVSELSAAIKRALEDGFGFVRLRGEISGFRGVHSSGHCYFALKDDRAKIEAVVWRSTYQRLKVKPEEGLEVVAQGRVTTFPGASKYQIVIDALEPAGLGALMALLEERKTRLAAEGLFDDTRKRKLPFLPRVVGIVTSPTGAVIRDMLAGFKERFPTRVVVWPVRVQGDTCASEVAAAIRGFNALAPDGPVPKPDVIIVARGGGSLEDLWGFNEELVVRAAHASAIPVISAIGHETDWSLLDLAADARAPTPTKAAEWAVPKYSELVEQLGGCAVRLVGAGRRMVETARTRLKAAARGLPRLEGLLGLPRQRLDACSGRLPRALLTNTHRHAARFMGVSLHLRPRLLEARLTRAGDRLDALARRGREALFRLAGNRRTRFQSLAGRLHPGELRQRLSRARDRLDSLQTHAARSAHHYLRERRRRLESCAQLLASLGYQSVLRRGYALVRDEAGRPIRKAAAIRAHDRLQIELADGRVRAQALEDGAKTSGDKPEQARTGASPPSARRPRRPGGQGSLF